MDIKGKSGNPLEVTKAGRAQVDAKSELLQASLRGDAYGWTGEKYDYAAADSVFAIRNESDTKDLHIYSFALWGDATDSEVEIHYTTAAYTNAGTAVVGINLNANYSGRFADATATTDETGNTQGNVFDRRWSKVGAPLEVNYGGAVVIPKGTAFVVDVVTGGDEIWWSCIGYFKDPDEL